MTASVSLAGRRTSRILACQRLYIFKGISTGIADITRRVFSRLDAHQIPWITTKVILQRPADIKNESNASELLLDERFPGPWAARSLLEPGWFADLRTTPFLYIHVMPAHVSRFR